MRSESWRQAWRASSVASALSSGFIFSRKVACEISERATPTTPMSRARNPWSWRLNSAGTSLRWVRSPEAPKMTTTHGSPTRTSPPVLAGGAFMSGRSMVSPGGERSRLRSVSAQSVADGLEEVVEGFGELLYPFGHQCVRDVLHGDARLFQGAHDVLRPGQILGEALPHLAVVPEGIE